MESGPRSCWPSPSPSPKGLLGRRGRAPDAANPATDGRLPCQKSGPQGEEVKETGARRVTDGGRD
eukprot:14202434-Alexandrium_andersonii.AAC.1